MLVKLEFLINIHNIHNSYLQVLSFDILSIFNWPCSFQRKSYTLFLVEPYATHTAVTLQSNLHRVNNSMEKIVHFWFKRTELLYRIRRCRSLSPIKDITQSTLIEEQRSYPDDTVSTYKVS